MPPLNQVPRRGRLWNGQGSGCDDEMDGNGHPVCGPRGQIGPTYTFPSSPRIDGFGRKHLVLTFTVSARTKILKS